MDRNRKTLKKTGVFSLFLACVGLALMVSVVFPGNARAGEGVKKGSRFCLVIPPDVKRSAEKNVPVAIPEPKTSLPDTGKKMSFFKGNMKKVGVGTPDCFILGRNEKRMSFAGPDMIYRDVNGYAEALNGDLEIRPFFPSAGYFNRVSKDGTAGVALGVGVKGPQEEPGAELDSGNPSAGLSLMIGFGF